MALHWLPPLSQTQHTLGTATRQLLRLPLCRYVLQTYARPELVFVHGEGPRMWDAHGKEYLDFAAGIAVNALGELWAWSGVMTAQLSNCQAIIQCCWHAGQW